MPQCGPTQGLVPGGLCGGHPLYSKTSPPSNHCHFSFLGPPRCLQALTWQLRAAQLSQPTVQCHLSVPSSVHSAGGIKYCLHRLCHAGQRGLPRGSRSAPARGRHMQWVTHTHRGPATSATSLSSPSPSQGLTWSVPELQSGPPSNWPSWALALLWKGPLGLHLCLEPASSPTRHNLSPAQETTFEISFQSLEPLL